MKEMKPKEPKDDYALPKLKCKVCGHEWTPRTTNPIQCPSCKSPKWDEAEPKMEEK